MKLAKSQLLVISSVLIASAAGLLALLSATRVGDEAANNSASAVSVAVASERESAVATPPSPGRPSTARTVGTASRESTSALLQSLGAGLSGNVLTSLTTEVELRFADYLANLDGTSQRKEAVRLELVAAYGDILAFARAVQQGDISPAEAEARTDPNYVLNRLASLLSSEELTDLESLMETEARRLFGSTYGPQIEVAGVRLNEVNQENLLDTLFRETYLLVNSNGLGTAANLDSGLQLQLHAIENARASLRLSMTPEQFEEAEAFLSEQERGIRQAQTIFTSN